MEIKHNDATPNRPEGDRVTDAPYVLVNMHQYTEQLLREDAWEKNDRNAITVFKTPGYTMVLSAFKAGAVAPSNIVRGTTAIQVISGDFSIKLGSASTMLTAGSVMIIHEGKEHSIEALADSLMLITTVMHDSA